MTKRLVVTALSVAALVAACASVPMAPSGEDAAAKRFDAPPANEAALYIFRPGQFNAAFTLTASVGQRMLGQLSADSYFRVDVAPGDYDVRCIGENTASVPVRLAAGETRYVAAQPRMGMSGPRCAASEVDATQGRAAVLSGRRALEIR